MRIGIGYRGELAEWIEGRKFDCLEITAEHFFKSGEERLTRLGERHEVYVHGLGLSLGTPGELDRDRLGRFARLAEATNAKWVSEHVAFTRTAQADLGHLNPVRPTVKMAEIIGDHARQLADACGRPVLLENITSHLKMSGELSEPEFLNALCERGKCRLLLNLFVNSRNHGFDPLRWLSAIRPDLVTQLHIVGYARDEKWYTDSHGEPIQPELIELARTVVTYAAPEAVILERDENFTPVEAIEEEVRKLEQLR